MRLASYLRSKNRVPVLQAVKIATATVSAWLVAQLLLPSELPIFAAMAALLVVQPSVNQSFGRAVERTVGVIGGVIIALGISLIFGLSPWVVLLTVVVSIFVSWLAKLGPVSANQVPISAMLVLAIGAATPEYALDRIIETIIGAVIGVAINMLIVPPVLLAPAADSVQRLAREIAATLDRLAVALRTPQTPGQMEGLMIEARLLRPMHSATATALTAAEESLMLNPRKYKYRPALETQQQLFLRLGPVVTRTLGMTRAVRDHYDSSLIEEPSVSAIAMQLERASHDLLLLVSEDTDTGGSATPENVVPALTAPLTVATPNSRHWILIGSLLEDLRRIHEEIAG